MARSFSYMNVRAKRSSSDGSAASVERSRRRPTRPVARRKRRGTDAARDWGLSSGRLWSFFQWTVLLCLAVYAAYQSHYIVFRASFFKLQSLQVVGNSAVPEEHIIKMAGLELGTPVFELDRELVASRVRSISRVDDVEIEQHGPSRVIIHLTEKKPVARVYLDGEPLEVSIDGTVLGSPGVGSSSLPWILGGDVLPAQVTSARRLEPRIVDGLKTWFSVLAKGPLAGFSSISFPEPDKIVVMKDDVEYFLGSFEQYEKHRRYLPEVVALQSSRKRKFQYVDVRFQDIVARFHHVEEIEMQR